MRILSVLFFSLLCLCGCDKQTTIVNNLPEREANEIVVYLASKGIPSVKIQSASAGPAAAGTTETMWSIAVDEKQEIDAMAILNKNGLPRMKSTSLLELFAKQGLISSEREETIRYQAGLAAQIAGTIRKIDGVVDAVVELSMPKQESALPGQESQREKITASVFVKHQGVMDDPNSHLVAKVKRLVSASVSGLDINDVTVISDRSRFASISLQDLPQEITPSAKEYVSIWSIVMSKSSTAKFRFLFFTLIVGMILFALLVGWMVWKFYPILRKGGLKKLLSPAPFRAEEDEPSEE